MKLQTLIRRSLRFHWRSHLGVVLGAAIGSAALIGALVVGDSVKGSLHQKALERLGHISLALNSGDRFFTEALVTNLPGHLFEYGTRVTYFTGSPTMALVIAGVATAPANDARANNVNVLGIYTEVAAKKAPREKRNFWVYSLKGSGPVIKEGEAWINEALANQLQLQVGDSLLLRLPKPNLIATESAMAGKTDNAIALRVSITGILSGRELGDFALNPSATAPLNVFVNLSSLQNAVGQMGRANHILYPAILGDEVGIRSVIWKKTPARFEDQLPDWAIPGIEDREILRGEDAASRLQQSLAVKLADLQAELGLHAHQQFFELRTKRVFLDMSFARAIQGIVTNDYPLNVHAERTWGEAIVAPHRLPQPILTYLATLLRVGTNTTPYSMVTAAGAPWTPTDLRDDEIVVSQWLADDLQVKPGDEMALSYFLPESGARLEEATNRFRVHSIVPMEMPWADRTLMPDFPGIEKAESTSEWDAGFPLTYEIRKKDDDYWKQYRGTPKAFITLAAGQKLWGNRFGNLTAIRFPIPTNDVSATTPLTPALSPSEGAREKRAPASEKSSADISTNDSRIISSGATPSPLLGGEGRGEGERQTNSVEIYRDALEKKILANLKPEELGLRFEPVREHALKAASDSQDFGGLFLGFSFFLIIAALLLMAMLFQFGLEQRAPEIGTLLALGFTPKQVRNLLLREGLMLAFLGGIIGVLGGIYFAKAMLHGLATVWRDAVGAAALNFHVTGQTLVIGLLASVVVSTVVIGLGLRKFEKRPARELLVGEMGGAESKVQSPKSKVVAIAALVAGVALVGWAVVKDDTQNAGIFFGAGALVLIAGLSFTNAWLSQLAGAPVSDPARGGESKRAGPEAGAPFTTSALAVRGCARRRKRSLATVAMLACGSFLIVSIGVFRLDANQDATQKTSGTGGFALLGETTLPVVHDLNRASGRDFFALNERDLEGVNIVPFRVRAGDEASCLNLNRAQKPRLIGVKPELLAGRFAFAKGDGWPMLQSAMSERRLTSAATNEVEIAAIGDANSIQWAMGKKVGDTIDYVDERGQPFKVRIVGAVANSILQGQLIIDEAEFVKRFPGESGYRMFLMDAPSNAVSQVSATLSRAMQDLGLELTPTAVRLNQFNAVQNTYLGTFQVLGGLGLLLGSVGLGIVVLRNVLERRSELAVLLAVGFRKPQVQRLLLLENGALLLAGLAIGVVAAAIAVLPALLSPASQFPLTSLALTLGAVLLNGAVWTWAATRYAVRGDLLAALRNE